MLLLGEECLLLLVGIILLRLDNKLSYFGGVCLVGFISIPALYFIPGNSEDLYRYFLEMNTVKSCDSIHSLFVLYKTAPWLSQHKMNYLYDIFQWIISRSGNYALLAFLSAFIVYLCIFIPFIHQAITNNWNTVTLFFGLFLIISLFQYDNVISTIRWNLAVSIFFLIVYYSINCIHPILTIPLYIIPLFIHEGTLLPVLIIIISIVIKNVHITKYMYLLFSILSLLLLYLLVNRISIFRYYKSTNFSIFLGTHFMTITFWVAWIVSYIYAILGICLIKDNININYNLEQKMEYLSIVFDILLLPFSFTMANRYSLIVGLCGVLIYLKTKKYNGLIRYNIKYTYILLIIICLLIMGYAVVTEDYNFSQINFGGLFNVVQ